MGLLAKLLFFPVAGPVAGIRWTLGQVQRVAEQELTDDSKIKNDLMELQLRLELEEIDEAEYAKAEAVLMQQLRDVREWRERLG
jgi:Gas vesicle protein G